MNCLIIKDTAANGSHRYSSSAKLKTVRGVLKSYRRWKTLGRGKGILLKSETNTCFQGGAVHPQGLKASKRSGKTALGTQCKAGFPGLDGAWARVRELEEVTIPHQGEPAKGGLSWVCPVPLWVFPSITRDSKLGSAGPPSAPW